MMRVPRISASMRGTTPGLASGGAYATPLDATLSLRDASCTASIHVPSRCHALEGCRIARSFNHGTICMCHMHDAAGLCSQL